MKRRGLVVTLVSFVVIVAALLGINIAAGNTPVLGLDLKGGLSVIYRTTEPASADDLIVVRDLMRGQLEDFGIAEPDVRVEGENIVVDLPGVSDRNAAFDALDISGIVELRPVYTCQAVDLSAIDETGDATSVPTGSTSPSDGTTPDTSLPTGTTIPAPSTTGATVDTSVDTESLGGELVPGAGRSRGIVQTPSTTLPSGDTTVASDETTVPSDGSTPDSGTGVPIETIVAETVPVDPTSTPAQEILEYPAAGQICIVGPAGGSGEVFERGSATVGIDQTNGQWVVDVNLRTEGEAQWNLLANQCYNQTSTCPSRQLAIVLDDEIQSAPLVNAPSFQDTVQISGAFSEDEARSLARTLNRGAFPVQVERERVESVSPTGGQDSLNAAIIAGLVGVAIMLLVMVLYYGKISIVIVGGLLVWGMTVFSLASFVSQATNYACSPWPVSPASSSRSVSPSTAMWCISNGCVMRCGPGERSPMRRHVGLPRRGVPLSPPTW